MVFFLFTYTICKLYFVQKRLFYCYRYDVCLSYTTKTILLSGLWVLVCTEMAD